MVAMERRIGKVTDYRPGDHAARIHLRGPLSVGDTIHIRGPSSELEERVDRLETPQGGNQRAGPGDDVGIEIRHPTEEGADVFLVDDPYENADPGVLDRMTRR